MFHLGMRNFPKIAALLHSQPQELSFLQYLVEGHLNEELNTLWGK